MKTIFAVVAAAFAMPAFAALNIFACTPEWGSLAAELGGDKAKIYTAASAFQDAHRIEARPSLIAAARRADLVVCNGAELEIGWLPLVLSQSGNAKIQTGQPGYFEAASAAVLIERPVRADRALGDVHVSGNPHLHLDPRNVARVAQALGARLASIDRAEAGHYAGRTKVFLERWREAMARWEKEAAPLKGLALVVYHRDMSYLIAWTAMREVASLEPKPGLPATPGHLAELVDRMKREPAKVVVYSPYQSPRAAEFLAERSGIPSVMLPYTVGGSERAKDLFGLFDDTLARLLAAVK